MYLGGDEFVEIMRQRLEAMLSLPAKKSLVRSVARWQNHLTIIKAGLEMHGRRLRHGRLHAASYCGYVWSTLFNV